MTRAADPTPPADRERIVDLYFMENRAKVIDVAAFLDRVGRTTGSTDVRVDALEAAIEILLDGQPERARRVLELFSDHTTELAPHAIGQKGATGVPKNFSRGGGES